MKLMYSPYFAGGSEISRGHTSLQVVAAMQPGSYPAYVVFEEGRDLLLAILESVKFFAF
jgi:hypothetical protein